MIQQILLLFDVVSRLVVAHFVQLRVPVKFKLTETAEAGGAPERSLVLMGRL